MNNYQPLVSIGVPTYCRPQELRRLLNSLVTQTYQNLEIIVSDNCSLDSPSKAVVKEFASADCRIKYFQQPQNIGIFHNYKYVLDMSQGDYFAWAADDDWRAPEFVETCLREFQRSDAIILVNTYSQLTHPKTGQALAVDQGCTTVELAAPKRYRQYLSSIYTIQSAVGDLMYGLMKRQIVVKVMAEQVNIIAWDHVFLASLALEGEFYTDPHPLMYSSYGGISLDNFRAAKAQLIQGSPSEKKPVWVKELCLQRAIRTSSNLSWFEKITLSIWSYFYYLTSSYKLIAQGLCPPLYGFLKQHFK